MRRVLFVAVAVLAVAVAGIAYAQDANDTVTLKSVAPSGGSATKPKPVAPGVRRDHRRSRRRAR